MYEMSLDNYKENEIHGASEDEGINDDDNTLHGVIKLTFPNFEGERNVCLDCDESPYICYEAVKVGSPCLSFDIIPDSLGNDRADRYPLTVTFIGGTQVEKPLCNNLLVMKLSNIHKTKASRSEYEESESSGDDDEDSKPDVECALIRHHAGCVNRVKVTKLNNRVLAASWSETGKVHIWDLSLPLRAINDQRAMKSYIRSGESPSPVFTFTGHLNEGFSMDWSPLVSGVLATGDCEKNIHIWKPMEGGSWLVDPSPYTSHKDSVEDIQWSPNEVNVMATCSVDMSIKIWDIRVTNNKACMLTRENAHNGDVNVISWNKHDPFILSGGDDGKINMWDLRKFPSADPVHTFHHHTYPVTSIEWHPTYRTVFAASASDNQLTQWDLAAEKREADQYGQDMNPEILALPPQLLFIHRGQKEIKELHWHKQIPGVIVSTAEAGFNVFRTLSV